MPTLRGILYLITPTYLEGAIELIKAHKIKHIFVEENQVRMSALGISINVAVDLLASCGYKLIKIGRGEWYATID